MRNSLLRLTLSALAVLTLAMPAAARQDESEHVAKTMQLGPGGTLKLNNFSGHVTITGSDRSDVSIDAVRRAPRERLQRITLDIHADGSDIVIEANHHDRSRDDHDNVVATDFDIKVPTKSNLDVHVFSAPVEINGVEGSQKIKAFSGGVDIRTKGWQDRQSIDVDTFSGSIDLRVPDSARGNVSFNTFSGKLTSDVPLTLHSSGRKSLDATLGSGDGGTLHFKTFSGNVHINK